MAFAPTVGLVARFWKVATRAKAKHIGLVRPRRNSRIGPNIITKALIKYGLRDNEKFIPRDYLVNSREVRLAILAGLIDTDGSLISNCYEIAQKSERLAKDIVFLARSLGLAAYVKKCEKSDQFGTTGKYWRTHISGKIDAIPVLVSRKKAAIRRQIKDVLVTGIKVESIGRGNIMVFN